MVMELTNLCNLACVHCAVSEEGHEHHAVTGYMSEDVVDSLLADMTEHQIQFDALILFWLGEPLIHPQFNRIYRKILRACEAYPIFKSIEVHTNAITLTADKRRIFLNQSSVPQKVHCTLDAMTAQTYQKVKGRDYFSLALQHTEEMLTQKHLLNSPNPRIVIQYIVGSNNVHEVQDFVAHWKHLANVHQMDLFFSAGQIPSGNHDGVFFRQLDCPTPEEQANENTVFREAMDSIGIPFPEHTPVERIDTELKQPCSGFWKSPVIDWKGRLTMCTRDNELINALGNVCDTPFHKLWWGEQQRQNRIQVSVGNYDALSLCSTCFIPQSCNHSDISVMEIQQYTTDTEL